MIQKFADMPLGTEFIHEDGGDGEYDESLYKVSDTEAVNETRSYSRDAISPNDEFPVTGMVLTLHETATEIERAALTVLDQARGSHPALQEWIQAMIRNPDEMRGLNEFSLSASIDMGEDQPAMKLTDYLASNGYRVPTEGWGNGVADYIFAEKSHTEGRDQEYNLNQIVFALAHSVHMYRIMGRPDGDQSHTLSGMQSPLISYTTSLAAAVVEFHQARLGQLSE